MLRALFFSIISVFFFLPTAWSANEFKTQNPDIYKYEFARSYISSLSYLHKIDERRQNKAPKTLFPGDDERIIKASINYLSMDSADIRIAKNYLAPYLGYPNALMRKIADLMVHACNRHISINNQEKVLWVKWGNLKAAGQADEAKEKDFINAQRQFSLARKEVDKDIIQASIYTTKALLKAEDGNENGHLLAITSAQRKKLLNKLDSFAGDYLDWGLKPGQRTLQASIAVIREVLEDSIWISLDEK